MNSPVPQLPLRDIHLPGPISWWPPAPGWWILLALLITGTMLIVLYAWYQRKRNRMRRVSLKEIDAIQEAFHAHKNNTRLVRELSVLLRRVCVSRYPRVDVASLTGVAWMSFLDRNRESKPFSTGGGMVLMTEPYRKKPDLDANALLSCCRSWIAELPTPK
ncbi:MAG TPA: DUF4381 domain-containing protein [Nitrospirales bacterium]|jgi:hypothetical protein|nr:DUF4381 domain-containing protein [Nitrospirales bacterium]HIA14630.1 DUF4381 domain-containing protein [Nitrospirales bacterium]HIN33570.1 DUF4381 domain-containing protein [Nitrospirales bacterium]